jgi:PAS domain-containing protein
MKWIGKQSLAIIHLDFRSSRQGTGVDSGNRQAGTRIRNLCREGSRWPTTDVSARKEVENQRKAFVQRLSLATQTLQAGIWDWDMRTNLIV